MAIIQISQIKHRRGLEENLPPALGSGELGWAQDSQRLFIGNGVIEEGAPQLGNTEILTEHSNVLELTGSYTFKGTRATYNVATKHLSTLTEDFLAPTPRSVGDKLDDNANIRDFGGLGDAGTSALTKGDLTAINYAIEQLYNSTLLSSEARVRRSLHFPSGIYVLAGTEPQDYIHLPPCVKLEGAGKNSTFIIQINPAAECVIKAETNGTMGATGLDISGITFITVPNIDILIADKVTDCRFDNVRFQKTSWSLATKPIPSISLSDTPYTAISPTLSGYPTCVKITNSVKNLSFNQCDFVGHYSAVHTGVLPTQISDFTFSRCLFTKLYSGIVVGINEQATAVGAFVSDGNGTTCNGVQVVNSVFDEITAHAIIGDNSPSNLVSGIISAGNIYRNVGSGLVDAINLSGDNCYSIGDIFPTTTLAVNFNDKKCFATLPDGQLRLGTQHYVGGSDIELSANTPAYSLAGVVGFKNYPTIVEYTLLRYGEQRVGSLKIAPVGTAIAYSDDYAETDDIGVTLKPQLSLNGLTVELYYSAGNESVLKIASRTLTGIDNVPAPVLHAPDAPTNVTVVTVTNVLVGSGLWTVGYNYYGQLGDGTSGAGTDKSSPVQVGTLTNWKQVAAGFYHNAAIKTDGSLWTCGYNGSGQLGDGTTTHKSSPVQVGTLTNWAQVACGEYHTAAVKTDGSLWTCGYNNQGQLGDGTTTNKSSPVQVGTLTNWAQVACGYLHTAAVKTDGSLWTCGYNGFGQLGDGTNTNKSSPVQVGTLTNWAQVAGGYYHTAAVKTDGTLWTCGYNANGQLGDGTTTNKSSPVQVGSLTNWAQVASGWYHTAAVKTDGSLWTFGYNNNGQLGDGTTANKSSPVQVGSLTNWAQVAAGLYHTAAVKTDGSLWTCGYNLYGQLGDGTTANRSSPVQVGTLTNWAQVAGGLYHTAAVSV